MRLILEFGTNFSTILDDGHPMLPEDPLNAESDWVCKETGKVTKMPMFLNDIWN